MAMAGGLDFNPLLLPDHIQQCRRATLVHRCIQRLLPLFAVSSFKAITSLTLPFPVPTNLQIPVLNAHSIHTVLFIMVGITTSEPHDKVVSISDVQLEDLVLDA